MSDSTAGNMLDQLIAGAYQKEQAVNALADAMSPASLYGRRAQTTAGLTWGYYGGKLRLGGVLTNIAHGTVALTASATNYVEASATTGAVSRNTTAFTPGAIPLYTVVTGTASVTSYTDQRAWGADGTIFATINMASDANRTLTQAEASARVISLTSASLTATRNVVFPLAAGLWVVRNGTTGGQSIQCIGATGTGVTIANAHWALIYCDGTNFRMLPDLSALGSLTGVTINDPSNLVDANALHEMIQNDSGGALTRMQAVYLKEFGTTYTKAALARANSATTSPTIGLVEDATVADGANGSVRTLGMLEGCDTSAWSDNTPLYLSDSVAGAVTATPPVAVGSYRQMVAIVVRQHATLGRLFVVPTEAHMTATAQKGVLENCGIAASVAGNALTIALTQSDGSTAPANTDGGMVRLWFRSATAASGARVLRTVTGALSLTLSNGSTLGFAAGETGRIWVGALDNAGTVELCAWKAYSNGNFLPVNDDELVTTVAEGGAGGADSALTLYSATARSAVPFLVLGYVDVQTGATAGQWANAPTRVQPALPTTPRPGMPVQQVAYEDSAGASGTTVIPYDNTIPQVTEGDQYGSISITPKMAVNALRIQAKMHLTLDAANNMTAAMFRDGGANAVAAAPTRTQATAAYFAPALFDKTVVAGSVSATTFTFRAGPVAGTCYFNSTSSGARYGGTLTSTFKIEELMA